MSFGVWNSGKTLPQYSKRYHFFPDPDQLSVCGRIEFNPYSKSYANVLGKECFHCMKALKNGA